MAGKGIASGRLLRALSCRALLALRHHYFSFITAGVLAGLGVIAMTGPGFDADNTRSDEDSAAAADDGGKRRSFAVRGSSLIYYVVQSQDQAAEIQAAMHSDIVGSDRSSGRNDFGEVFYLEASSFREEADMGRLLNAVVELASSGGYVVSIIDLRR